MNNYKGPSFWRMVWLIIKNDWPVLAVLIALSLAFSWLMVQYL